jgi:hypothetical protein
MKESVVIHEIFSECSKFTLDSYWIEQFQNFACNKFPPGVRYDPKKNALSIKVDEKRKADILVLPTKPSDVFTTMMDVLKTHLNMCSTRDLKLRREEMEELMNQKICDMNCEWNKIRPRHLKDHLIMDFLATLKEKHALNDTEARTLAAMIFIGFKFKYLSQNDVEYEEGVVKSIRGLKFNKKTRHFTIPYSKSSSYPSKTKQAIPNKVYSGIDRFIKNDMARMNKYRS